MNRDRLFLERKGLLFQQRVELFALVRAEFLRPLRGQQVATERAVQLRHLVGRGRGRGGNVVGHYCLVAGEHCLHGLLFGQQ